MNQSKWVSPRAVNPAARVRLFCFPFAGGGAATFVPWKRLLLPEVEVCPVQLPGRETRFVEAPHERVETLVPALLQGLEPLFDLPFAFFGHSMGALIAFELAQRLREEGRRGPALLHVAGAGAPSRYDPGEALSALDDAGLVEALRHFEGTPASVLENAELLELVLPTIRADFALCESYRYRARPPLECSLVATGGTGDLTVAPGALDAWAEHTRGPFRLRMVPGGHFFLEESTPLVLRQLATDLTGVR